MKVNGEKMKRKILFVSPNLHHGGAESVLVKILNNIDLTQFDIKLVLLRKEGKHLSKLNNYIKVIDLNSKNPIISFFKLRSILKKENPDYVFSIIGHVNLILSLLKSLFFRNTTFLGRENVVYSEWLYKDITMKKRVLAIGYKIFLKRLDYVIVQSTYMANQVQDYFRVPEGKLIILNNPIEHERIAILSSEDINNDKWQEDKINLISIGRIEKVKNYYAMVDIIELLPEKFQLNIFGEGNEQENLEKYINYKGLKERITIHGFVENPYKYLKKSHALLLTSERESFPNVVLEANACGIYAITFDMPGGIKDIIKNGINGSIVSDKQIEEFANEIMKSYKQGYNAQKITEINKRYSIDKYMNELYNKFI